MIKKAFFASAVCALCFLASCGNKNQEQTTPAEEVVGEEVTTEVQDGDTLEVATGEVEQLFRPAQARKWKKLPQAQRIRFRNLQLKLLP